MLVFEVAAIGHSRTNCQEIRERHLTYSEKDSALSTMAEKELLIRDINDTYADITRLEQELAMILHKSKVITRSYLNQIVHQGNGVLDQGVALKRLVQASPAKNDPEVRELIEQYDTAARSMRELLRRVGRLPIIGGQTRRKTRRRKTLRKRR